MGSITTTFDTEKDLTVVKATGKMEANDFREWIATYYKGPVTRLLLWNITEADLSKLKAEEIQGGAILTKTLSNARREGKSAIVASDDLGYGIGRTLAAFYEIEDMPFTVRIFRTIEEAMKWLGV